MTALRQERPGPANAGPAKSQTNHQAIFSRTKLMLESGTQGTLAGHVQDVERRVREFP